MYRGRIFLGEFLLGDEGLCFCQVTASAHVCMVLCHQYPHSQNTLLLLVGCRGSAVCDGSLHPDILAASGGFQTPSTGKTQSGGVWRYYEK